MTVKMTKTLKPLLAITIVAATIGVFVYYFSRHPATLEQLGNVPLQNLLLIFALYVCFNISIALILIATVDLCNVKLKRMDGILLTIWSSIINFFGPLQSGPAFRAAYLKKVHGISLKNYGLATLMYYFFYAVFSGICLLSGIVPWQWLLPICMLGVLAITIFIRSPLSIAVRLRALPLNHAYKLMLATLLQIVLITVIYVIELKSVDPGIHVSQAIVYSGAANFALFVSITPGAIGFREAFLVFSQNLHHVPASTILTANVIDRSAYVLLLGVLFVVAVSLHVQKRYAVSDSDK